MMQELNNEFDYVLGSKSPRRKELLEQLGLNFTIRNSTFKEENIGNLKAELVPEHYAREKAFELKPGLIKDEFLITADTDVILDGAILGKAENENQAKEMLQRLSGKWHEVTTGMCLMTRENETSFSETTKVKFKFYFLLMTHFTEHSQSQ